MGRFDKKEEAEPVRIADAWVKHASEKALLVQIPGHKEPLWFPRSQIHDDSEVFDDLDNDSGTLVVTRWIAEQKGLVEKDEPDYGRSAFDDY